MTEVQDNITSDKTDRYDDTEENSSWTKKESSEEHNMRPESVNLSFSNVIMNGQERIGKTTSLENVICEKSEVCGVEQSSSKQLPSPFSGGPGPAHPFLLNNPFLSTPFATYLPQNDSFPTEAGSTEDSANAYYLSSAAAAAATEYYHRLLREYSVTRNTSSSIAPTVPCDVMSGFRRVATPERQFQKTASPSKDCQVVDSNDGESAGNCRVPEQMTVAPERTPSLPDDHVSTAVEEAKQLALRDRDAHAIEEKMERSERRNPFRENDYTGQDSERTDNHRTAELINKQISQIEKELTRKAQNENIKKTAIVNWDGNSAVPAHFFSSNALDDTISRRTLSELAATQRVTSSAFHVPIPVPSSGDPTCWTGVIPPPLWAEAYWRTAMTGGLPNLAPTFYHAEGRQPRPLPESPTQASTVYPSVADSKPRQHRGGSLTNLHSYSSSFSDLTYQNTPAHQRKAVPYSKQVCTTNDNNNNSGDRRLMRRHSTVVREDVCSADAKTGLRDDTRSNRSSPGCQRGATDEVPVWVRRDAMSGASSQANSIQRPLRPHLTGSGSDTDTETDNLLGLQRFRKYQKIPTTEQSDEKASSKSSSNNNPHQNSKARKKEVIIHEPAVLIEGVLFRAKYLGSTQILCDGRPTKASRMMQAHEAVTRIKVPEGESQPMTDVDLFISTEKIMVLNTDLQRLSETDVRQDIMMDHPLRTISYIADIADLVVLMARRVSQASPDEPENSIRRMPKLICHVFESDEAQFIAQSIGQAFQVAYMEFLRANGIDDPGYLREMDYQEVLNSQEMMGEELELFARKETQKEVVVPKHKNELLGTVIVESGWGSMLPTVVVANLMPGGPAARCNQINVGDHIIALNGISFVGLPLATCQGHIKNVKQCTAVKMTLVHTPPVVEVRIKRPDTKYQLGFSVQNGVICSLLRGGIAERGGIRVGHRIIEINGHSVVAVPHEKIVTMLATAFGEIHMKTMPTSMFRLLTGQEQPVYY